MVAVRLDTVVAPLDSVVLALDSAVVRLDSKVLTFESIADFVTLLRIKVLNDDVFIVDEINFEVLVKFTGFVFFDCTNLRSITSFNK